VAEAEYVSSLFKPDLVLLDINISGDDGRQLCWKIKHAVDGSSSKVILMSACTILPADLAFWCRRFYCQTFDSEYLLQKMTAVLQDESMAALEILGGEEV
jgi:DNA-binding response OmpR family regulator